MSPEKINTKFERLYGLLGSSDFLAMKGLASDLPIFIQTYQAAQEDDARRLVASLAKRLRKDGVVVELVDLFDLVLKELDEHGILEDLIAEETSLDKMDILETLQNYSDPANHVIPRLVREIGGGDTQLTLISGSGRVHFFLRTHTILESLKPENLGHPVVLFFPGEYVQESRGGSHLSLFGSVPSPRIKNPYYRAKNLDHYGK